LNRKTNHWRLRPALLLAIFTVLNLALAFWSAGCALTATTGQIATTASRQELRVVTSFLPIYIFTANLVSGIDGVSLENMAAPDAGCLHDYQLLPKDMILLEKADVFIINGAGMEGFLAEVAQDRRDLPIITASDGISFLSGAGGEVNSHVWLSVPLAIREVQQISLGLQKLDPVHAAQYKANEQSYAARLEQLNQRIKSGLSGLPQQEIITFHEAFSYFAAEYGLTVAAVITREPGSEPTAAELASTINLIRTHKIAVLFAEPQYPATIAETICNETGARLYMLDPVVTGTAAADTYEKVMDQNLQVIRTALGG
jgi:zinc transport system substrate-binding protein